MTEKQAKKYDAKMKTTEQRVWIFQGNPLRYKVYEALCDESLKEDTWLVSHYSNEIHIGDTGLIWKARKASGIYAVGTIISNPQVMSELPESGKYWIDKTDRGKKILRVLIRYKLKLKLTNALFSKDLKKIPELRDMQIFKQSQGTNFRVGPSQWQVIKELLKRKYNFEDI
jgi:hypothetical protein